jgi:hypothetical protein
VITKRDPESGDRLEPLEEAVIEVAEEHVGQVVDLMGQRKAQMVDMTAGAPLHVGHGVFLSCRLFPRGCWNCLCKGVGRNPLCKVVSVWAQQQTHHRLFAGPGWC